MLVCSRDVEILFLKNAINLPHLLPATGDNQSPCPVFKIPWTDDNNEAHQTSTCIEGLNEVGSPLRMIIDHPVCKAS